MIIKKFQGKTEQEAIESAKKELGLNMVIMNVRNVKKKGFLGFFSSQMVEVTVALEEESEREQNLKKEKQAGTLIMTAPPKGAVPRVDIGHDAPFGAGIQKDNSAIEDKLDSLQELLEQQLQKPEEENPKMEETEIETEDEEMVIFMKLLYHTMLDNEVNEKYANQILNDIEKSNKPNMPFDYTLANTYQKMILKFGKTVTITPAKEGPKVVFFVGPTGVGKTTTIAKIASQYSVEKEKKVALLTADTYRIAAAEQLRTYANILEVPFRVIYTIEEVEQALKDFKQYDYILVDTAGHSHQDETQRNSMRGFIHSVDGLAEKEVFLVISATTKYRDLISIADTYSGITDYKIIFTKLDETTTLGNLLNLKLYTGASISYVTCGQNVPDDIEEFNPQKTVKQLLGGRK